MKSYSQSEVLFCLKQIQDNADAINCLVKKYSLMQGIKSS